MEPLKLNDLLNLLDDPYDFDTKYLFLLFAFFAFKPLLAQAEDPDPVKDLKPPKNRELFHDYVDKQQKDILRSDGKGG